MTFQRIDGWNLSTPKARKEAVEKFKKTNTYKLLIDKSDEGIISHLKIINKLYDGVEVWIPEVEGEKEARKR